MFKTEKELKSFIRWSIFNGLFFIGIYFWLIDNNIYASNLSKFLVWLHFICSLGTMLNQNKVLKEKYANYTKSHLGFYMFFDITVCLFVAAFGHFVFASMYFLGSVFQWSSYSVLLKEEDIENCEERVENEQ